MFPGTAEAAGAAAGAAAGGAAAGAAAASAPHSALRKSFHFWPFSVPVYVNRFRLVRLPFRVRVLPAPSVRLLAISTLLVVSNRVRSIATVPFRTAFEAKFSVLFASVIVPLFVNGP